MTKKIAFQGEPGAFSHAAASNVFPGEEFLGCVTFEETLNAVQSGAADFAVVPVENSLYGRITDIHHLLPESGLHIIGETYLRVEMTLLGVPGARLEDITAVQSLSVALGQCRKFISGRGLRTINGQRGKLSIFALDDKSATIEASIDEKTMACSNNHDVIADCNMSESASPRNPGHYPGVKG